jgi:HD-GYP domain-containing protein (c-di-GMP phosphodiesterase class II)
MEKIVEKLIADDSPQMQASFAQGQKRSAEPMARSEIRAELIVGGAYLVAAVALAVLVPTSASFDVGAAVLVTIAAAVFSRIKVEVGGSYTSPLQLAFVPMLFIVPPELVPIFLAASLVLGQAVDFTLRSGHPGRAIQSLGDAWFAMGPALVLALSNTTEAQGASLGILVAAFAAQVGFDLAAGAIRDELHEGFSPAQLLRESALVIIFDATLAPVGFALAMAAEVDAGYLLLGAPLALVMGVFARERQGRLEKALELSVAYRGTAKLLGDVVEHDDAYTGVHTQGVLSLSLAVAEQLGLEESRIVTIESAALLHDVGKIAVPKEIINKPGPLDEEEWEIIKTHTVKGQEMLDRIGGLMRSIGSVVRSCHERYDGAGYPDGLAGEEIPIEARVIFVCDAYNAMTTDRSYRKAMSTGEAIAEVRRNAGSQFDPRVAEALEHCVSDSLGAEPMTNGSNGTVPRGSGAPAVIA